MATLEARDGTADAIQQVIDKEAIRELVLAYSRAIDRFDLDLLRDLYTEVPTDQHGPEFAGDLDTFIGWIERLMVKSMPSPSTYYLTPMNQAPKFATGASRTSWPCAISTIIAAAATVSGGFRDGM
jgi:hypothetical protein